MELSFVIFCIFGSFCNAINRHQQEPGSEGSPHDTGVTHLISDIAKSLTQRSYDSNEEVTEDQGKGISESNGISIVLQLLLEQERRITRLEGHLKNHCNEEHFRKDDAALERKIQEISDHVDNLEYQLNPTSDFNETKSSNSSTILSRKPRNFLGSNRSSLSIPVAFDAYRNKPFRTEQAYVNYDGTNVNTGNALNVNSGIFTAPISGIYLFSFHALTQDGRPTYVKIIHNGRNVGGAYRRHEGEENNKGLRNEQLDLRRAEGMLGQTILLSLEEGDDVSVFAYHGNLRDGGWHYTHFMGFLLH